MEKKRSEARRITLKFEATCKACGTKLPVGTKVTWYPRGTVYGLTCHKSPFAEKKATPKTAPAPKKVTPTPTAPVGLDALAEQMRLQTNLLKVLLQKLS